MANKLIKELTQIGMKEIKPQTLIFTKKIFCGLSYPGYKHGCPNYGVKATCPPNSPYLESIKKEFKYFYLVYAKFDLVKYSNHIRQIHPEFTDKQCKNPRFYQNSVKSLLLDRINEMKLIDSRFEVLGCGSGFKGSVYSMEAVGIHVFDTCKNNDIILEKDPFTHVTFVCLIYSNHEIDEKKETHKNLMEC